MGTSENTSDNGRPRRILAVVDWSVDAEAVAADLRAARDRSPAVFGVLVPSRLPGLDWIAANHPLSVRRRVARRTGRHVDRVVVSPVSSDGHWFQRAPHCAHANA